MAHVFLPPLMLVTDRHRCRHGLLDAVLDAVAGGIRWVQLREKDWSDTQANAWIHGFYARFYAGFYARGPRSVLLSVNSRPLLAFQEGLGMHWPEDRAIDIDIKGWRLGLQGQSVHSLQAAQRAAQAGMDYVVAGAVWETSCKPGQAPLGLDTLRAIVKEVKPLPVYAIGGMGIPSLPRILDTGAAGVAVCSAVLDHPHPQSAAAAWVTSLGSWATPS